LHQKVRTSASKERASSLTAKYPHWTIPTDYGLFYGQALNKMAAA